MIEIRLEIAESDVHIKIISECLILLFMLYSIKINAIA